MRRKLTSVPALVLALLMLAGCGSSANTQTDVKQVKAGETISSESKWINSSIDGAIDHNTPVNLKDDFYTAANRDWLLAQTISEDTPRIDFSTGSEELMRERKLEIVKGENASAAGENPADIPEAQLKHNEELLVKFGALASNWEERAAKGVEPLRPYVEAIERIAAMEDMTDYLLNKDGKNFTLLLPVDITVGPSLANNTVNTVVIDIGSHFTLSSAEEYSNISSGGKYLRRNSNESVTLLLQKLGYSQQTINRIIKDCYRFETRLAKAQQLLTMTSDLEDYLEETDNRYSFAQLKDIQGDFPLAEILAHYGYDGATSYTVTYPKYIASISLLYCERYLDEIKAYYMVHTLNAIMPLLDRETFDALQEMKDSASELAKEPNGETPGPHSEAEGKPLTPEEQEAKLLLDHFISPYLGEPLEQIYVARYCTAQQKEQLKALISDIIAYYRVMLLDVDWLSVQARDKAVEKLEHMTVRAVYPDDFSDYTGLDISGCDNLVDAAAVINAFSMRQRTSLIDTPAEYGAWNMKEIPTTLMNAFYKPTENSINILAGIIADEFVFNVNDRQEETLAKIGMIIGHEITHGFDTMGYLYDKDGNYASWWTAEDEQAFQLRASRLANYYSGIIPYPGASGYNGENVKGEAIADMGGLKCMLGIAKDIPGFDYELFFRSYASLWKAKNDYATETVLADDVHPLHFLRVNTVVQQFEEFYETFGITKGDGMYLAPDDRVAVW